MALDYGRSFSLMDTPECPICSERYDDLDDDLIPRNLACGHSLCSRKRFLLCCCCCCTAKACVCIAPGYPCQSRACVKRFYYALFLPLGIRSHRKRQRIHTMFAYTPCLHTQRKNLQACLQILKSDLARFSCNNRGWLQMCGESYDSSLTTSLCP